MIDTEVLNEIQYYVLETPDDGATLTSDLWTVAEVIGYLNQRQREFLKDTCVLYKRADLATVPGEMRHTLPDGTIFVQHVTFRTAADVYTELRRVDLWQLDTLLPDWETVTDSVPRWFLDSEVPTMTLGTAPATMTAGVLEALYVGITAALSNTGVSFEVPDECVPAIMWGVVADMLSKEGRGQDVKRAAIAQARYMEGREMTKLLLTGWL